MIDFQAYYDRQLAKIGSSAQELEGARSNSIQFTTKMMLIMEHNLSVAFRVSKEYYKGRG